MRIAYCTPSLYMAGGMERVLTVKANYLADKVGYDVYIIITEGMDKQPYYQLSSKVHLVNLNIGFDEIYKYNFLKKTFVYLKKQCLFKKKLTDTLMHIHPDITDSLLRRDINFISDIKDGSIKIGEIHNNRNNYRNFEKNDTSFFKNILAKFWMYGLVQKLKRLDRFIVLSTEDKGNWNELKNVEVINNPISFSSDKLSDCNNKNVIAVGRYAYQKGFDLLIEAWKLVHVQHNDWNLYVYGAGNKEPYQTQVSEAKLEDSCHLEGSTSDIISKYNESSIFVLSSRFEGFPMVLPEAMSCGLPCVAFTCPCGTKDIIKDGIDGLWVDNGNIKELADKICYLIENEDIRKGMGHQATINIQRLNLDNIMKQWIDLFNDILKNNG